MQCNQIYLGWLDINDLSTRPTFKARVEAHSAAHATFPTNHQRNIMSRYLVMTQRTSAFDPAAVEAHYHFLGTLRRAGRIELAGPFADRTGGAYLLLADDRAAATELANRDPLHLSGSSLISVREWEAK